MNIKCCKAGHYFDQDKFSICPICGGNSGIVKRDEIDMLPKRRVCANCKNTYIDGDMYCRFCGAPMGEPDYIVEDFACIYGPKPCERTHHCEKCGYSWTTNQMIDDERWCPKCGGSAPATGGWIW